MTIADDGYFQLVDTLTDMHRHGDAADRAITENQIQVALCEAGVFPESSED